MSIEEARNHTERHRARTREADCRAGRLFHHVAELPGEDDLALAFGQQHLDAEEFATDACERRPGGDADLVGLLGLIVLIRTFLSFSLETEIEGAFPWRRREQAADQGPR